LRRRRPPGPGQDSDYHLSFIPTWKDGEDSPSYVRALQYLEIGATILTYNYSKDEIKKRFYL